MRIPSGSLLLGLALTALAVQPAYADGKKRGQGSFKRIATLANYINNDDIGDETVSEIVAATADGQNLVYTDSEGEAIGFVNIGVPSNPIPTGTFDVGGEPTSVAVLGNDLALVSVNTSESFTDTGGTLVVVDINQRSIVAELDLGGQPDAIAISPDGQYAAVAIENERDEELCVGGTESGAPVPEDGPEEPGDITEDACEAGGGAVGVIPQTAGSPLDTNGNLANPAGYLAIVDLAGDPANWSIRSVELTGLAGFAPSDPEPEFVDINDMNRVAISLQENNHLVIVDLPTGAVTSDFPLGTVDLFGVDATEDGIISLTENLFGVPREPDAIAWVNGRVATANEGDLFGGSRGFSLFGTDGSLDFDTGSSFEELAVSIGHYPEERSENKGSEPEAIEYGEFGGRQKLFVGSERGSFIGVYGIDRSGRPRFEQALAGPLGPEGLLAIPGRNLLVVSGEEDDPSFGVRSSIMIYEYGRGKAVYPQLSSKRDVFGKPIGFSAMSGMVAGRGNKLLAVWDSFYSESQIFEIRTAGKSGAVVTSATTIVGGSGNYDPEGIAIAPDGTYWIASEGNRSGTRLNRLIQTDTYGNVLAEVFLPAEIENCRAAERAAEGNIGSHSAGFEGVAVLKTVRRGKGKRRGKDGYKLLVAQQRGWDYTTSDFCEALDDDSDGSNPTEPGQTRIWIYDPQNGSWDHVAYELEDLPENASWVGLSEITDAGDGSYVLIERDNRTGDFAELKTLVRVDIDDAKDGVSRAEKSVYDILPDLEANNGWVTDKPEGVAIDRDGDVYLVTDNDGVDDWSGETWFLDLGDVDDLFDDDDDDDDEDEDDD
jgi:hypothetical protein